MLSNEIVDNKEYEFIGEKISNLGQAMLEKVPLVDTVRKGLLEKKNLSNDLIEDILFDV